MLRPTVNHVPAFHTATQLSGHAIIKIMVATKYLMNFMVILSLAFNNV